MKTAGKIARAFSIVLSFLFQGFVFTVFAGTLMSVLLSRNFVFQIAINLFACFFTLAHSMINFPLMFFYNLNYLMIKLAGRLTD